MYQGIFKLLKFLVVIFFFSEVMMWHVIANPLANLMYGSLLALLTLPFSNLLGLPPIYLCLFAVGATFLRNPRRRLVAIRDRRAKYWDRMNDRWSVRS